MNYETAVDSFITTVDDIFSHASREKENSPISEDGEITPILIRRAEVFVRTPTRTHVNKKKVRAYRGQKLQHVSQQSSEEMKSPTDEWKTLYRKENYKTSVCNITMDTFIYSQCNKVNQAN